MAKIILAQLNPISGNVEYNKNKAIDFIERAKEEKADLIVFPELFLLGYPIGDILERYPKLSFQCQKALDEIKEIAGSVAVLIGYPERNTDTKGKPYYNSVAFIQNKQIKKTIRKTLLANYSEHNDYRYFESEKTTVDNKIIEINNIKYGVIICEDGWNDKDFFKRTLYKDDPIAQIAPHCDILISISASCSRAKKEQLKHNLMVHCAKKYNKKYIYINQVGANDELVYDGLSRMYDEKGELCAMACAFEEDFFIIDTNKTNIINPLPKGLERTLNSQKEFSLDHEPDLERTYLALKLAIKDYFSKNGFKKAVLGLSGGLDSAICAVLLADALGKENVLGVFMPSKLTSDESENDAKTLAKNLRINYTEVPIKDMHSAITDKFDSLFLNISNFFTRYKNSFTQDNIQARSRALILWSIANEFVATLPVATSDKSELYMGYATINGDMSGGYAPISDVCKTKLFALAKWMNKNREEKNAIPVNIINKPPQAELAIDPNTGKTLLAQDALMPYEFLDEVIWRLENLNQNIDDMLQNRFLYEKSNIITKEQKKLWLEKFFKRLNSALYKWYIAAPGPIIDARSINKAEFRQPVISNINYSN